MSLDDLRAKLADAGIPLDGWGEAGGQTVMPPVLERQKKLLIQVRGMLEAQVGADKDKISELHVAMQRMKHGGGV